MIISSGCYTTMNIPIPDYIYLSKAHSDDELSIWSLEEEEEELERSFRSTTGTASPSSEINAANTAWSRWDSSNDQARNMSQGTVNNNKFFRQVVGNSPHSIYELLQNISIQERTAVPRSEKKMETISSRKLRRKTYYDDAPKPPMRKASKESFLFSGPFGTKHRNSHVSAS